MMKFEYEAPEMEIVEFETQDCITASDNSDNIVNFDDIATGLIDF